MAQTNPDPKSRHIQKILAHVSKKATGSEAARLENFIKLYFQAVAEEDLLARAPADLFGAAYSHWRFGQRRKAGEARIRIYNPSARRDGWKSTHTIVEMVNDDMPFLVDSLSMALNKHGLGIHLTIHPIYHIVRDERGEMQDASGANDTLKGASLESFLHVEFDRRTDKILLREIQADIESAMHDVRAAIDDWSVMRAKANQIRVALDTEPPPLDADELEEGKSFIDWLENNHFTFLGYREYDLVSEKGEDILKIVPGSGLGILRETSPEKLSRSFLVLPKDVRKRARAKELLIITKANSLATVHRRGYMDYIGIKRFNAAGEVIGERRFLGLFTSSAYSRSPRNIPLLRLKVEQVLQRSGLPLNSHGGKALLHILETFPRDELFQSTTDELFDTAMGVLQLQERQRVKLFMRRDSFGRFFSCLIYVPRDRYNTQIRERIQEILKAALHGKSLESSVQLSESALARVHIIVRTTPWRFPKFNRREIERQLVSAVRSWQDELREVLVDRFGEERGLQLHTRYAGFFPTAYQDDVTARAAAFDVAQIDELVNDESLRMSLYRPASNPKGLLRFKLFHREQPIPISDALPMLENMGLKVISERPYEMELGDASIIWIQDFDMIRTDGGDLEPEEVKAIFQDAFENVWRGTAESDGFNKLVLSARLTWRETALIRAYCKYLLQTGIPFSQAYMEQTLLQNAEVARVLVDLFEARFDPALKAKERDKLVQSCNARLDKALDNVISLDDDRILRGFANVVRATLRTNYYQTDAKGLAKSYVSFKFDPARIPDLPLPRPMYEIFVYSPRVEGVHLRGGKVARGGLRWSDRREDFRTEVLGLMKAQMVKNTLIVPVGAKGGFYVKQPPQSDKREAVLAEGINCYKMFISALLDITDNIVDGKIVPPPQVVRHDEDDPYLVVAADKGTATFSDIANGVANDYGFWMGDAFASGGSAGYDHKKMGITAKGAWESVKRHFREMGIDTQTTNFSVVGIGDMAGDVFGNGMLLSRHIQLKAAFNHMHIFLDPNPDPETSFSERERLFNLPRSSWGDYDTSLISKGGGIFPRSAKQIPISPEVRAALDIEATVLTPIELIRAILKAPVDLLWNGGIGTYVKATTENNTDVGDRANDGLRVNGRDLRCKVVGEGGNLGCTQLGRIEYGLKGGRVNTDFIDNSAGVDCSDHEVNIKILFNTAPSSKRLDVKKRNKLLADMTDEVSELVLRNNYMQAQALSIAESQAPQRLNEHAYLMRLLERQGFLNRALEFLPDEETLVERRAAKRGLSRPELAVLLAYSKITIFNELVDSDVPEDTYLAGELEDYFPKPLREHFGSYMPKHRLRREIIATAITNSMVNRMGPTFAHRMQEETGTAASDVARAYTIAREIFDLRGIWAGIEELDNRVPASIQVSMMVQTGRLMKHATRWLLDHLHGKLDIAATVPAFAAPIAELTERLPTVLAESELAVYNNTMEQFMDMGVPQSLARRIAALNPLFSAMDIVEVANAHTGISIEGVAKIYFDLGTRLDLDWLREQIEKLDVADHWQAVARGTLREDLYAQQRQLTAQALGSPRSRKEPEKRLEDWSAKHDPRVQHAKRVLSDMRTAGPADFATLSVALQEIRKLARAEAAA